MAKKTTTEPVTEPEETTEETVVNDITETLSEPETTTTEPVTEVVEEPIYVPEVPAQIEEHTSNIEVTETDEILFLRSILDKQRSGGFGRHLDGMINERINFLKGK